MNLFARWRSGVGIGFFITQAGRQTVGAGRQTAGQFFLGGFVRRGKLNLRLFITHVKRNVFAVRFAREVVL